jgi:hypothetical protein
MPLYQDLNAWVVALSNRVSGVPADQQLPYVTAQLRAVPEPPREALTLMYFMGGNMADLQKEQWQRADRKGALIFGIVTVIFLAVVALVVPEPKPFALFIFRLIASLGAGGVGAFLPGALGVSLKRPTGTVRATGALALAVIVYLINPPALGH